MNSEVSEILLAKYLENQTNEAETLLVLERLMNSEKDRQIVNLAAAGLQCLKRKKVKFKRE